MSIQFKSFKIRKLEYISIQITKMVRTILPLFQLRLFVYFDLIIYLICSFNLIIAVVVILLCVAIQTTIIKLSLSSFVLFRVNFDLFLYITWFNKYHSFFCFCVDFDLFLYFSFLWFDSQLIQKLIIIF